LKNEPKYRGKNNQIPKKSEAHQDEDILSW
jgi:hypothetical protein